MRAIARGLVVGLLLVGIAGAFATASPARAASDPSCQPWAVHTVASGLGVLENLEPDARGGMLISNNGSNEIDRLTPDGHVTTFIPNVPSPGGQRIHGDYLYFNTGDSAQAGATGSSDGTIERYDLRTGSRITWSSGLAMPNGLLFLPNGDAVVSRDSPGHGITRIPSADPMHPQANWVQTNDSNGLAIDPTGTWIYFDQTFQPGNDIMRARISNPSDVQLVASLGQGLVLDDLTIDRDGILYIAANRPAPQGELIRFDPDTKQQCTIATGLGDPSAVKFGCGPGWSPNHLYAVGFEGSVYDIATPPGAPAPEGDCDAQAGAGPGAPNLTRGCAKRRRLSYRIHQPRHGRIVEVSAYVDGRLAKRAHGRRITRLRLRAPRKTNYTVRIVARSSSGRRTISTRRYRGCTKTRPHTHAASTRRPTPLAAPRPRA